MNNQGFSWLNVLLIDDSQSILSYVSTVLETNYGIDKIYQATSAEEAINVLQKSNHFNLLFIDLNMPNIDGIQLLKQIKELNYTGYLVIMSGVSTRVISSVELLAKQYNLNYIATLLKPLHESDFSKVFSKLGKPRAKTKPAESLKTYEIIRALKNNDFTVHYQPQVSLSERKFVGVEALCRIKHPRLGIVTPDKFIDKAEESELIQHITFEVIKQAFTDWNKWRKMGLALNIAVNVSPSNLQLPDFADHLLSLLKQHSVPVEKLCVEVTENILATDKAQELSNISRINMHGIKIALDDFGTMHATIERLQKLPIDCVKLDKSYFIESDNNNHHLDILNTTLALSEKLHVLTCAEGIETGEAMNLATDLKCDIAQGYFISEPLPARDILPWAQSWNQRT